MQERSGRVRYKKKKRLVVSMMTKRAEKKREEEWKGMTKASWNIRDNLPPNPRPLLCRRTMQFTQARRVAKLGSEEMRVHILE